MWANFLQFLINDKADCLSKIRSSMNFVVSLRTSTKFDFLVFCEVKFQFLTRSIHKLIKTHRHSYGRNYIFGESMGGQIACIHASNKQRSPVLRKFEREPGDLGNLCNQKCTPCRCNHQQPDRR